MSLTLAETSPLPGETPTGRLTVHAVRKAWYVLCRSEELGTEPLPRKLHGAPIVLFRDGEGNAGALLDRCPHRMVPLSLGEVDRGELACGYHGWRFDRGGRCTAVPGLCSEEEARSRDVPAYATREQDGWVWVWGEADAEPEGQPYRPRTVGLPGYLHVVRSIDFPGSLHQTLENALDVPHTAFLHRGLFRGGREPVEITAVLTRDERSVQAEFVGEPRPEGLAARLLAPKGAVLTHFDRFHLPSVAEVEYRLGERYHIVTTSLCTPVEPFVTRLHALVSLKLPLPGWLVATGLPQWVAEAVVQPVALNILRQDAWILGEQTDAIARWGGERYQNTEIDLIGGQIGRMLKRAATGASLRDEQDWRREVRLKV